MRPKIGTQGFTLIEVVVALVVITVGLTGVMAALRVSVAASADPLEAKQLTTAAEALMDEIMLQPFNPTPNSATAGCSRATFNDVDDYNGYRSTGICLPDGQAIAELAAYSAAVDVTAAVVSTVPTKRISVTITRGGNSFSLVAHKADLS